MRREKMWKQWQAAWLFHHIGPDAMALLFSDEVGSWCTLLANNYCEDAYDLLQTPLVKNLLGGAPVELRISQRKTYHDDGVAQNGRNPSNLKIGTTNTVSPKIANLNKFQRKFLQRHQHKLPMSPVGKINSSWQSGWTLVQMKGKNHVQLRESLINLILGILNCWLV